MRPLFALLSLGLLAACGPSGGPGGPPPAFPPPGVTVANPVQKEVQEWDEFSGRTEATETVEVRPRVSGTIDKVHFASGQLVKAGDLLFTIDPRPFQALLDRASAELQRAKTQLDFAKKEVERSDKLIAAKAISSEEADAKSVAYRAAGGAVRAAEAAEKTAALDVEFCSIRSAIPGRVSRALVTAGNYVSGMAGMTTQLTTVVTIDPIHVYADIDEATFLRYSQLTKDGKSQHLNGGTPVEMQHAGEAGFPHKGTIESFDNRISATTGSILLRAVFENADEGLRPGTFVRLRVPAGPAAPALLIPEVAIGTDQGMKFVLTVNEQNTVVPKPIILGSTQGDQRIIRSGITVADRVIINGLANPGVRPGAPVTPGTGEAPQPQKH
jgi:RND family efflux transporter MFP subunit